MQISVTFRHRESDEGVKDYVRDRVEKLEKYLENPMEIHVVLTSEKFRQIAEITVVSDGVPLNSPDGDMPSHDGFPVMENVMGSLFGSPASI